MPWGYLFAVTLVAVCTLAAAAPLRRPRRVGRWCWILGMVPNEAPFLAACYLGASTLLAALQGDLGTPVGRGALVLAAVTVVALVLIVVRAAQTDRVVRESLRDSIGVVPARRRLPIASILLAPILVKPHDVQRTADVAYGERGVTNTLDLYEPRTRQPTGMVLIHFHGGGYRRGNKSRESRPLLHRLAREGWLCVSANYGLHPSSTFVESRRDAQQVVEWVRAHAHEHGVASPTIFLAGSSAGGHLALTTAFSDPSIAGAIALYAYYGDSEEGEVGTSPLAHLTERAPPVFVVHGENDTLVPVEAARELVERVRAVSRKPIVYAELPGAQHSFDLFHSIRFERVIDGIEAFTGWAGPGREP